MIRNFVKKQTGFALSKSKGFTLVELLVVIAIIGLLSTIVVVSFGAVRDRARDTAIRANMTSMRLAAELHFDANATFVGANLRTDYLAAVSAANAAGGTGLVTAWSAGAYCMRYGLPGGGAWCIDSTGNIGATPAICNAALFRCNPT